MAACRSVLGFTMSHPGAAGKLGQRRPSSLICTATAPLRRCLRLWTVHPFLEETKVP